jgi:hypothetical protein
MQYRLFGAVRSQEEEMAQAIPSSFGIFERKTLPFADRGNLSSL